MYLHASQKKRYVGMKVDLYLPSTHVCIYVRVLSVRSYNNLLLSRERVESERENSREGYCYTKL